MAESKNGMLWVLGLTGGIACGKSSASSFLQSLGAKVIDADKISRAVTAPGGLAVPAIEREFGPEVFKDGELDRRELGRIVFSNDAQRRRLEALIHPLVQQQTLTRMRELAAEGAASVVLDVPLLYETGMDVLCDEVWLMAVPPEEQLKRVIDRDKLDIEQAQARIDSQMALDEKQALADRVIWSNRNIQNTHRELETLWQMWSRKVEKFGKTNRTEGK